MNESPWTQASNYPYTSSYSIFLGCYFLTTFKSFEAFLTGAFGFYYSYYSDDSTFLTGFLATTLFFGLTYS